MTRLTPGLPLSNLIVLAEDAIRSAINDYKSKRQLLNMAAAAAPEQQLHESSFGN